MNYNGGLSNLGVLFQFDPITDIYTSKLSFNGTNGGNPKGSLNQASDGKLYGMTYQNGTSNNGVIFQYDPATSSCTKKMDFNGTVNGKNPSGSFMQGTDGKLYGMTYAGGTNNLGVLFQYDFGTNTYIKKFDFDGTANGGNPYGSLMQDSNGKMYGMTYYGSAVNRGLIFQYDPVTSVYTKKIEFLNGNAGFNPNGSLVQALDGKLYGMTKVGGANNLGVLFQFDPSTHIYSKKLDFNGAINGSKPVGSLMQASDGKLYGMTTYGGANDYGVLFQYDPATDIYTKKIDLGFTTGIRPSGNLMQASDGKLYGMTNGGSAKIFQYDPATNIWTIKYNLGGVTYGTLLQATDGKFYGMQSYNSTFNYGTLFQFDPLTSIYSIKVGFSGPTYSTSNGGNPWGSLIQATDGKLYGLTATGGLNNVGVMFQYDPSANIYMKKVDFAITNSLYGDDPYGTLLQASNGKIYGVTSDDNSGNRFGTMFQYDINTDAYNKTFNFSGTNGDSPLNCNLIELDISLKTGSVISTTQCGGSSVAVPYYITGKYNFGNVFTAQLSDATGSFASPVNIGSLTSTIAGTINAFIPLGTSVGSGYRIRVVSDNPVVIGNDNGNDITINTLPSPIIAVNSGTVCSGTSFTFSPTGGITYTYINGSAIVSPTTSTSYTVIGTDASGCSGSAISTLSVIAGTGITVNSGSICIGNSFTITPSGALSYTYSGGSSIVNPGMTSYYYVTGIDVNGCLNSAISNVTVNPLPVISVNNGMICSGSNFTMMPTGASTYTFSSGSSVVSPTSNTSYTVTGTSVNGCVNNISAISNVTVSNMPTVTIVPTSTNPICSGSSITLSASGATSYFWPVPSSTNSYIIVAPNVNTIYSVWGTSGACTVTKTISVNVNPTPSLTLSSSSNTITCINSIVTSTVSGATSYSWSGVGIVSGSNSSIVSLNASGIYTVVGSYTNCSSTRTLAIISNTTSPTLSMSVINGTVCPGTTMALYANSSSSPVTYLWNNSATTPTINISPTVTSIFTATITNSVNGCASVGSTTVNINSGLAISVNSSTICYGNSDILIASGATSYTWFPAVSLNSASGSSVIAMPLSSTVYTVEGASGTCSGTTTATVTVLALPFLILNNDTVCSGSSITLSVSGANAYSWNTGATTSSINIAPTITETYTVTSIDTNSCSTTQTVSVTVDNSCQDVWPGDANSDGIADNLDVLELGLHYTQTGTPRVTTNNNWQSYFANNWIGTITNGKNVNHSDCNGDGTINNDDTLAIYNNYSLTHTFKPTQTNTVNPQISIIPDQSMIAKGSWGSASVYLGDATTNINNINGVAFTLDFDNTLIEPNSIYIEYQNSFIDVSQNLHFRKPDFANGKIFTATTHTINNNVSGFGKIATLHYQIKSSLVTDEVLNIGLIQANQSDASGLITPLTTGTGTLLAVGSSVGIKEVLNSSNVSISPNPTSGILNIAFSTIPQNTKIEVYNSIGALVLTEALNNKNNTFNTSQLSNGMYLIKVLENNRITTVQKIVKQ